MMINPVTFSRLLVEHQTGIWHKKIPEKKTRWKRQNHSFRFGPSTSTVPESLLDLLHITSFWTRSHIHITNTTLHHFKSLYLTFNQSRTTAPIYLQWSSIASEIWFVLPSFSSPWRWFRFPSSMPRMPISRWNLSRLSKTGCLTNASRRRLRLWKPSLEIF